MIKTLHHNMSSGFKFLLQAYWRGDQNKYFASQKGIQTDNRMGKKWSNSICYFCGCFQTSRIPPERSRKNTKFKSFFSHHMTWNSMQF